MFNLLPQWYNIVNYVSGGVCAPLRQNNARIPPICVMVTTRRKSLSEAIDNVNKKQFLKFSKAIADSTGVKETISAFENKKGYAGRRTLERCCQATAGFEERLPSKVIAERTGWSVKYVDKIRSWWEQEATTGTVIEQKPYQETPHKQEESLIIHDLSPGTSDVEFLVANVSNNLLIVDR